MNCTKCPNTKCFVQKYCLSEWHGYSEHHKIRKQISASKTIFSQGDLVTGLYIICSGKVKVLLKDAKGEELIIRVAGNGQVLGHRGISDDMVYPISAETLIESEIAYFSNEDFFKLLNANKDLSFYMMMFFANELHRSEQLRHAHWNKSSEAKVAVALLMVINAFGYKDDEQKVLDLGMNYRELSKFARISYPTLSRVLKDFAEQGIVRSINNELIISDIEALNSFVS